jgi:hypothetical protein
MSAPRASADQRPISARRGLATLVIAVAAATVLAGAGGSLPGPPLGGPAELEAWWQTAGTPGAVFGLLRIAGLTLSGYVALLGLLGTVAAITRWSWADSLLSRSATSGMRRLLIGGGLAMGMSMSTVGAATSSTAFDLVDIGAATVEFELQDLGPVPSAPASLPTAPPRPEAVAATATMPRPEAVVETWTVVAGDHLWSIAARTVLDRGGDDGEATIAAYWLRLIDHNRDLVGDNPDLIHPGQMIRLPD